MKAFIIISGALCGAYSFLTGDWMGAWLAWIIAGCMFYGLAGKTA
jgi:hypothetical protein